MEEFTTQLRRHLSAVLGFSVDGSAVDVRQSSAQLAQHFYPSPLIVPALMSIITATTDDAPSLRQLAAVELRKRIAKHWPQLPADQHPLLRKSLLDHALAESDRKARQAVARVISTIAKIDVPAGRWDDLLPFLYSCCQSQHAAHREVGFYVIFTLLEVLADSFHQHLGHIITLFSHGLNDPESADVRITTLQALAVVATIIEPDDDQAIKAFRKLIPSIVHVVQQFLEADNEDGYSSGIELFNELVSFDTPLLSKHIPELVQFFLAISSNTQINENARLRAMSFFMWTLVYKKNKLMRLKLLAPVLQAIMPIMAEEEPEDLDEDSTARLAMKVLNTAALNVPPQQVFPVVWTLASQYAGRAEPGFRKAAMMSMAVMAEGCSDYLRNEFPLDQVIMMLCNGLRDQDVIVRQAACIAVGSLAQEMGTELQKYHRDVIPVVFALLDDLSGSAAMKIRRVACETLDSMLEFVGDDIGAYLPTVMEKLVQLLDDASIDTELKGTILSAIGSAAHASERGFQPFFPAILPRLQHFMSLADVADNEAMTLRAICTDTASSIAFAVGPEVFGPHVQQFMQLAMQGVEMNTARLRECGYCFFGMVAKCIRGDAFTPYLPVVVEKLFASCHTPEVDIDSSEPVNVVVDEDEDDEDGDHFSGMNRSNAIAEEKETAMEALGVIFEATKHHFLPHLPHLVQIAQEFCDHGFENVRKAAITTLYVCLKALWKMYHPDMVFTPGLPVSYTVHNDCLQMMKVVMDETVKFFEDEDEKVNVATVNSELCESLKMMGPVLIQNHIEAVCQHVLALLEKKAACQAEFEEEYDDMGGEGGVSGSPNDDDDQAEYDALVISTTADVIGAMAEAIGESFGSFFGHFLPHILKYYKRTKPVSDRSMAIGVIGEASNGLGSAACQYANQMLPVIFQAMEDPDEEVRSNAAFAIGALCFSCSKNSAANPVMPHMGKILTMLGGLFDRSRSTLPNLLDNACGAAARLMHAYPMVSPSQILPVLLDALPLRVDFAESEPITNALLNCLSSQSAECDAFKARILSVLATWVTQYDRGDAKAQITKHTRDRIVDAFMGMKLPGVVDAASLHQWVSSVVAEH